MKTLVTSTLSLLVLSVAEPSFAQQTGEVENSNLNFGQLDTVLDETENKDQGALDILPLTWLFGDDDEEALQPQPTETMSEAEETEGSNTPVTTPPTPIKIVPKPAPPAQQKPKPKPESKPKTHSKPQQKTISAPVQNNIPAPSKATEELLENTRPNNKEAPTAAKSTKERELERIEYYLNSITTIVADFTQVAPDGSLASGKFYMQRPGKMRWQYEPPTPVLIILNDWRFTYYDYELEQVTQLPVDSSLASILARETIDLSDPDLIVEEMVTSPGAARIKLHQKGKKEEGTLLLEMSDQPLRIRNIIVTDASGQTTTISLNKARFGVPLERSLFIWKDPRKKRR